MKLYLALALSLVFLTQCKNQKEATNTLEDMKESEVLQVEEATTKLESSDIVGKTFQAVLPCADCMGLQSEISFKESNQYEAKSFYLGKSENVKTLPSKSVLLIIIRLASAQFIRRTSTPSLCVP